MLRALIKYQIEKHPQGNVICGLKFGKKKPQVMGTKLVVYIKSIQVAFQFILILYQQYNIL